MKAPIIKIFKIVLIPVIIILINACHSDPKPFTVTGSYELEGVKRDTINKTDAHGWKQGKWEVKYWMEKGPPSIVESGNYKNNLKHGVWKYYDSTGKVSRVVNYVNDLPSYAAIKK